MRTRLAAAGIAAGCCVSVVILVPSTASGTTPFYPTAGDVLALEEANLSSTSVYFADTTGAVDETETLADSYYPMGIAARSDGAFWVGDLGTDCVGGGSSGHVNALRFYDSNSGSTTSSKDVYGSTSSELGCVGAVALSGSSVWAANSAGQLLEYNQNGASDEAPISTIDLPTGFTAQSLTISPDGSDIYAAGYFTAGSTLSGAIEEFSTSATGAAKPIRTLSGPETGFNTNVNGIAVGLDGTIYAAAYGNFLTFKPGADGDVSPQSVGTPTGGFFPVSIALSSTGVVYLTGNGQSIDTVSDPTGTPSFKNFANYPDPVEALAVVDQAPAAVAALTPTVGKNSVALSWQAPADDPIGYVVSEAANATGPFTPVKYVASTATGTISTTISGLPAGHAIYFEVDAGNDGGVATESFVNSATPYGVPGAPTAVALDKSRSKLTLKWKAPASDGGKAITGYDVTFGLTKPGSKGSKDVTKKVGAKTTSLKLTTKAGKTYYASVKAINSVGVGTASKVAQKKA